MKLSWISDFYQNDLSYVGKISDIKFLNSVNAWTTTEDLNEDILFIKKTPAFTYCHETVYLLEYFLSLRNDTLCLCLLWVSAMMIQ